MPLTHEDDKINILLSIAEYIKDHQFYDPAGNLTCISSRYANLYVGLGYPKDLSKIGSKLPYLALEMGPSSPRSTVTWERTEKPVRIIVYGFVGGLREGGANQKQLLMLLNDLENIFDEAKGGQNVIDLYDFSSGSEDNRTRLDALSISEVEGAPIHAGADDALDVSRYRFQISMTVGLWSSQ
jgi:hypothetical protein